MNRWNSSRLRFTSVSSSMMLHLHADVLLHALEPQQQLRLPREQRHGARALGLSCRVFQSFSAFSGSRISE